MLYLTKANDKRYDCIKAYEAHSKKDMESSLELSDFGKLYGFLRVETYWS